MNHMQDIARMFGVKMGEEFDIDKAMNNSYRFDSVGMLDRNGYLQKDVLISLLTGELEIIKKPFIPKHSEDYWFITIDGEIINTTNCSCTDDVGLIAFGNCFRTASEITPEIKANLIEKMKKTLAGEKVGI